MSQSIWWIRFFHLKGCAVKSFFSPRDIERALNVSYRQLQYWDQTDFIKPSYKKQQKFRLYTFTDVLLLKIAWDLRQNHHFSIQKLRKTIELMKKLLHRVTHPLLELTFLISEERILVFNGDVVMDDVSAGNHYRFCVRQLRTEIDQFFSENPKDHEFDNQSGSLEEAS